MVLTTVTKIEVAVVVMVETSVVMTAVDVVTMITMTPTAIGAMAGETKIEDTPMLVMIEEEDTTIVVGTTSLVDEVVGIIMVVETIDIGVATAVIAGNEGMREVVDRAEVQLHCPPRTICTRKFGDVNVQRLVVEM